jgi:hypothetical protein
MNKPFTMIVKETKMKLANVCNESGLSPVHLDLIMQGLYNEIHSLAERQTLEEEAAYAKAVEEEANKSTKVIEDNLIDAKK